MPHFGQRARSHGMRRLSAWRWNVFCETPFPSSLRVVRRLVGAVFADGWNWRNLPVCRGFGEDRLTTLPGGSHRLPLTSGLRSIAAVRMPTGEGVSRPVAEIHSEKHFACR